MREGIGLNTFLYAAARHFLVGSVNLDPCGGIGSYATDLSLRY